MVGLLFGLILRRRLLLLGQSALAQLDSQGPEIGQDVFFQIRKAGVSGSLFYVQKARDLNKVASRDKVLQNFCQPG